MRSVPGHARTTELFFAPWRAACTAIVLLGVLSGPVAIPAEASSRIVTVDGARQLVAVRPSGGPARRLFRVSDGIIMTIATSRDGAHIAVLTHSVKGRPHRLVALDRIWMMGRDGGRPHVIRTFRYTHWNGGFERDPQSLALSADGGRILVGRLSSGKGLAVLSMKADGSHLRRVEVRGSAFFGGGLGFGRNSSGPQFTPDGRRIVGQFFTDRPRRTRMRGIGTIPAAGGRVHFLRIGRVGTLQGAGSGPTVSDDGQTIAFVLGIGRSTSRIVLMRRDGTRVHALAHSRVPGAIVANPSFSPSGSALTYVAEGERRDTRSHSSAILTINRDGTHRRIVRRAKRELFFRNPIWTR